MIVFFSIECCECYGHSKALVESMPAKVISGRENPKKEATIFMLDWR